MPLLEEGANGEEEGQAGGRCRAKNKEDEEAKDDGLCRQPPSEEDKGPHKIDVFRGPIKESIPDSQESV